MLVDGMDLGKIFTALLFLAYYVLYVPKDAETYIPISKVA